jgi:hypothetical protein
LVDGKIKKENAIDENSFRIQSIQIESIDKITIEVCIHYCLNSNGDELCKMLKTQKYIDFNNSNSNAFEYDQLKKTIFINFFI